MACVLAEPALTNIGIVHPEPGFHAALRELTRRAGTLLIIDETHTICAGPGGYTRAHGLEPDMLTLGQADGRRRPGRGVRLEPRRSPSGSRPGAGSRRPTPAGSAAPSPANALATAAMRATLEHVLTEASYARTIPLAERFAAGRRRR